MPKSAAGLLPVHVRLDRAAGRPLEAQLAAGLREAILAGALGPGARLPSTRALADELGVSRNTALAAFEQLAAEGYLEARVGSGTRVARALPDDLLRAPGSAAPRRPVRQGSSAARLSRRGRSIAALPLHASLVDGPLRPFRLGSPALSDFPVTLWSRLVARRWARAGVAALDYGAPEGRPELRRAIAAYLRTARGVRCEPGQVVVTTGSQQALDLVARVLLDPGDRVWLEDPGYAGARGAFTAIGARLVPARVDTEGLDVATAVRRAPGARLAYVTPSHQFPLGVTMSLPRRLALLDWARRAEAWIVEDDYDSEFRYASRPLPALQGLDTAGRVVYVGTFSKVLFPSLRVGYLVVPPDLVPAFRAARNVSTGPLSTLDQLVLHDFLAGAHFETHLRRMRTLYRKRQEALVAAAARHLAPLVDVRPADGGMHLVGWLPRGVDDVQAARAAAAAGIDVIPLSAFAARRPARGALLLGYAALSPAEIEDGARRLARALDPGLR